MPLVLPVAQGAAFLVSLVAMRSTFPSTFDSYDEKAAWDSGGDSPQKSTGAAGDRIPAGKPRLRHRIKLRFDRVTQDLSSIAKKCFPKSNKGRVKRAWRQTTPSLAHAHVNRGRRISLSSHRTWPKLLRKRNRRVTGNHTSASKTGNNALPLPTQFAGPSDAPGVVSCMDASGGLDHAAVPDYSAGHINDAVNTTVNSMEIQMQSYTNHFSNMTEGTVGGSGEDRNPNSGMVYHAAGDGYASANNGHDDGNNNDANNHDGNNNDGNNNDGNNNDGNNNDGNNENHRHDDTGNNDRVESVKKELACHFYHICPVTNEWCAAARLKRLGDIKAHFERNHTLEKGHWCIKCHTKFRTEAKLTTHLETGCLEYQGPRKAIHQQQFEEIYEGSSGKQGQELWNHIWERLCPGQQLPSSPYRDVAFNSRKSAEEVNNLVHNCCIRLRHVGVLDSNITPDRMLNYIVEYVASFMLHQLRLEPVESSSLDDLEIEMEDQITSVSPCAHNQDAGTGMGADMLEMANSNTPTLPMPHYVPGIGDGMPEMMQNAIISSGLQGMNAMSDLHNWQNGLDFEPLNATGTEGYLGNGDNPGNNRPTTKGNTRQMIGFDHLAANGNGLPLVGLYELPNETITASNHSQQLGCPTFAANSMDQGQVSRGKQHAGDELGDAGQFFQSDDHINSHHRQQPSMQQQLNGQQLLNGQQWLKGQQQSNDQQIAMQQYAAIQLPEQSYQHFVPQNFEFEFN